MNLHHPRNLFVQEDEDQTSYDEQPVNAHGVQQEEAPEEEFGSLEEGADEPLQEAEEATASDSLVYDTEMVRTVSNWSHTEMEHVNIQSNVWTHLLLFFVFVSAA